jgi:hypothetical protein
VNGFTVPAMIDTGAEISVMSTSCAKRCGIWDTVDSRLCGKAVGVGTNDIVGGIEALSIKMGQINFANKVSILRDSRCDFLIGMDILKRFDSEISIKDRLLKLRVKDKTVHISFLDHAKPLGWSSEKRVEQISTALRGGNTATSTEASMTEEDLEQDGYLHEFDGDMCDDKSCRISMEGV